MGRFQNILTIGIIFAIFRKFTLIGCGPLSVTDGVNTGDTKKRLLVITEKTLVTRLYQRVTAIVLIGSNLTPDFPSGVKPCGEINFNFLFAVRSARTEKKALTLLFSPKGCII